jgi:hypothetical protein
VEKYEVNAVVGAGASNLDPTAFGIQLGLAPASSKYTPPSC